MEQQVYCTTAHWSQVSVMREINLFESLCLYRNLAACQLFSFNVLCVEHRQAGMLLYSFFFWALLFLSHLLIPTASPSHLAKAPSSKAYAPKSFLLFQRGEESFYAPTSRTGLPVAYKISTTLSHYRVTGKIKWPPISRSCNKLFARLT